MAISNTPRQRAWMFSSVASGGSPLNRSRNTSSVASNIGSIDSVS